MEFSDDLHLRWIDVQPDGPATAAMLGRHVAFVNSIDNKNKTVCRLFFTAQLEMIIRVLPALRSAKILADNGFDLISA